MAAAALPDRNLLRDRALEMAAAPAPRAAGQRRLLRWACLVMACSSCTAMRAACLGQRAMRVPGCTARTPLPVCSYEDDGETGSLEGEEEPDEDDDDDDGVESVVAYLPQLLEAKYGKNWESLMDAAPEDEVTAAPLRSLSADALPSPYP